MTGFTEDFLAMHLNYHILQDKLHMVIPIVPFTLNNRVSQRAFSLPIIFDGDFFVCFITNHFCL